MKHRHHRGHPPRPPRLFAEPGHPLEAARGAYTAEIDGAARGNPGPASYAVVVRRPDGAVLERIGKSIGTATNNVAEYYALIAALDYAHAHRIGNLRVVSDSELLVRQMKGHYRVKSLSLRQLHERARKLAAGLAWFLIEHVPREKNRDADALANAALNRGDPGSGARDQSDFATRHLPVVTRKVRARYRHGALHPAEPLDLAEGQEVEITIEKTL